MKLCLLKRAGRFFSVFVLSLAPALSPALAAPKSAFDPSGDVWMRWTFDEGTVGEGAVRDAGPNGHDGVIRSQNDLLPQSVNGLRGQALQFSGEHEAWVELDRKLALAPPFTIAAWVKPGGRRGTMEWLGQKAHSWREGFRLVFSLRRFFFEYGDGNENVFVRFDPHQTALDQWVFLAVVHDGGEIALYVDGEEVAREKARDARWSARPMLLGNYAGQKVEYRFLGAIDEMVILRTALPPAEIPALGRWTLEER